MCSSLGDVVDHKFKRQLLATGSVFRPQRQCSSGSTAITDRTAVSAGVTEANDCVLAQQHFAHIIKIAVSEVEQRHVQQAIAVIFGE